MSLYFITGNQDKLAEAKSIIPEIKGLDIALPEIQEIDAHRIINAKLQGAIEHKNAEFIVEDTSLYFEGLNGLPGPLIKWFLKTVGNEGLYQLAQSFNVQKATVTTIIGYVKDPQKVQFFEGTIDGTIVKPRGGQGFGFDPIFQPYGYNQTFAEMGQIEKGKISMRKKAFLQLAKFLQEQN